MGIFSLFGKKERPPATPSADVTPVRKKRPESVRNNEPADEAAREQLAQDQRKAARATALKIDAIESEMSSEFVRPASRPDAVAPARPNAPTTATPASQSFPVVSAAPVAAPAAVPAPAPAPNANDMLGDTIFDALMSDASLEDVPLFEEVAILFANGQTRMVEQILKDALEDATLGSAAITAWAMLFDLYQVTGEQQPFEDLSIAYASRFESSPPAWMPLAAPEAAPLQARAAAIPSVVFVGPLDENIAKSLDKARLLADRHPALRLEFTKVTEVDPIGCGLLAQVLSQLKKSGIDLILVGAPQLVARIRAILVVGRRDETETPWLLLMELLGMLNLESEFEEASIDYCVTFEVSPPAFVAPPSRVTTAMEEPDANAPPSDTFTMPGLIEGRTDALVAQLGAFAAEHNPARIDCAALARVDVNAAGQLLAGLMPLTGDGRTIEFINVNHLIAALFNVLGFKDTVRIVTRRI